MHRAHHCGVSLGGMLGLWPAAHAPEGLERQVVVSALPRLDPPERYRDRAAQVRAGGTAAVAETVVGRWFSPPSSRGTGWR